MKIDELKTGNSDGGVDIDLTTSEKTNVQDLQQPSTETRETIDLASLSNDSETKHANAEALQNPAEKLLSGDPDSMLSQYRKNLQEELAEIDAEAENQSEVERELDDDSEDNDSESLITGESLMAVSADTTNYQVAETEKISSLVEGETEESAVEVPDVENEEDITLDSEDTSVESDNDTSDIVEDEDTTEDSYDEEETLKHLQEMATERLKPIARDLDISSFTVVNKPTSSTKMFNRESCKAVKWVLPNQKMNFLMKEFTGVELQSLQEFSENNRSLSMLSRRYRMIYDHIVSAKPKSFEAWLKSTPFSDVDHYFFGIFIASYKGANYLPMDCKEPKCKETFLTDNIDIMNMVKFENDDAKKAFTELYNSEVMIDNPKGLYVSEAVPISSKLAIAFKEPSIYSLFESASIATDEKFVQKHSEIIPYIPFIDAVYYIDQENRSLVPIGFKIFPDAVKTVKSKIIQFDKAIQSLTSDEFTLIKSYASQITNRNKTGISYMYPAVTCPKCGKTTQEIPASAEELVFTRYQLGALVNTSLN